MEKVELGRYEITGRLGSGADYDVRVAADQETGRQVVLKRPMPQAISRNQHWAIEARTERMVQVYQEVLPSPELVAPILAYTDREIHDSYFGDELGTEYTVIVQERARGIPLLGDMMSKIKGVPIAAGQNLFAMFPLVRNLTIPEFPVHNKLLDLQQAYLDVGYVVLDLRPQNIFYQPGSGKITLIDTGALAGPGIEAPRGRPPYDANDACLELIKFYTTPEEPPQQADGYRDARGIRPIVSLKQEIDELGLALAQATGSVEASGRVILEKIRDRDYTEYGQFRSDMNAYLNEVRVRNSQLVGCQEAKNAWTEALEWLRQDYWRGFLFDAEEELRGYDCAVT